jgi:hypothetical protein
VARASSRADFGQEECLIRVDVSHTRDDALIKQGCLDRAGGVGRGGSELFSRYPQAIRTETRPSDFERRFRKRPEASESTWVAEDQLRSIVEVPSCVDVISPLGRSPRAEQAELACHAEMDDQDPAVCGDDRELLAPAVQGVHLGILEDGARARACSGHEFADVRAK